MSAFHAASLCYVIHYKVLQEMTFIFVASSGVTASHAFVLETKVQGRFQGSPAVITYRVPTKAALQV